MYPEFQLKEAHHQKTRTTSLEKIPLFDDGETIHDKLLLFKKKTIKKQPSPV
jgi:hypothetical protein